MDSTGDLRSDVRAYAALSVRLAEPDADREALLAEHGLDEESWDQLDDAWQARLSEAVDEVGDQDTMPVLVQQHAEAFAKAQAERANAGAPMTLERFIEITLDIKRGNDIQHLLKRNGTTLQEYLRAEQHWLVQMMQNPSLQAQFHKAMERAG